MNNDERLKLIRDYVNGDHFVPTLISVNSNNIFNGYNLKIEGIIITPKLITNTSHNTPKTKSVCKCDMHKLMRDGHETDCIEHKG